MSALTPRQSLTPGPTWNFDERCEVLLRRAERRELRRMRDDRAWRRAVTVMLAFALVLAIWALAANVGVAALVGVLP